MMGSRFALTGIVLSSDITTPPGGESWRVADLMFVCVRIPLRFRTSGRAVEGTVVSPSPARFVPDQYGLDGSRRSCTYPVVPLMVRQPRPL
jgi:hypothetical protein